MLNVITLSDIMLNVLMLSDIMLSVIMLSAIMLNVIMLSDIMLNVLILSAIMLNVVAPQNDIKIRKSKGVKSGSEGSLSWKCQLYLFIRFRDCTNVQKMSQHSEEESCQEISRNTGSSI